MLASNNETDVTLTVRAPAEQAPIAVEFVLDCTESFMTSNDEGAAFIKAFAEKVKAQYTDKNVYVGVTGFTTVATELLPMTKLTKDAADKLDTQLTTGAAELLSKLDTTKKGTNVQAGIRAGYANLQKFAEAVSARYVVLVTDGGSFYHYEGSQLVGDYNEAADPQNAASVLTSITELRNEQDLKTSFEKSILTAANELDAVTANAQYKDIKLVTIGYPYYKDTESLANLTKLADSFIDYAASKSVVSAKANGVRQVITTLPDVLDQLRAVVPAGSIISDVMGYNTYTNVNSIYNFDVVTGKTFTLVFYGKTMTGTLENNEIEFKDAGKTYAKLVYTPDAAEKEMFTLTLQQPLLSGDTLKLTYTEKLTSRMTSSGTYVVDTNNTAQGNQTVLTTSTGTQEKKVLLFPEPSLSYTVSGGGGGGGGNKPVLNKEDHFGYIIGYPVDYYTGEPTTDQTKKPVRPQGNITRAEVATIFFRMLTDESRTEFWSQTNDYSDVKQGQWFNPAISTLSNAGIISGYPDGTFKPNGFITRAEFATIAVRFFDVQYDGKDLFPDISTHWAKDYINQAGSAGLVNGYPDGTFGPNKNITRAEAVTLVNRTLDRHPDQEHFLSDMLVWPDNMDTTKWYYADMQEATNSHEYEMKTASDGTKYEIWTKMLPIRDWEAFEKAWSDANSATNPGEVVNKPSTSK